MQNTNHPNVFVERTIKLIDALSKPAEDCDLEVTFLLNCLLGLIVSTSENTVRCRLEYFNERIQDLGVEVYIPTRIASINLDATNRNLRRQLNETALLDLNDPDIPVSGQVQVDRYQQIMNWKLIDLVKKIRNGIAHQNIQPINSNGKWVGIKIWNNYRDTKDFEIEFTINELKDFGLFLARKYVQQQGGNG